MNKKQKALELFSYFILYLSKVDKVLFGEDPKININRAMKLLYLTCLESKNFSLFEKFGPFHARPDGPVNLSIYEAFDIAPGLEYNSSEGYLRVEDERYIPIPSEQEGVEIRLSLLRVIEYLTGILWHMGCYV